MDLNFNTFVGTKVTPKSNRQTTTDYLKDTTRPFYVSTGFPGAFTWSNI